jgi:hypothetical protein
MKYFPQKISELQLPEQRYGFLRASLFHPEMYLCMSSNSMTWIEVNAKRWK